MIENGHIELLKSTVKSKPVDYILPYLNSNIIGGAIRPALPGKVF